MVKESMTYLSQISGQDERLQLVSTLRTVTDGKVKLASKRADSELFIPCDLFCLVQIYVEVERARLTRILAGIKEAEGKVCFLCFFTFHINYSFTTAPTLNIG